MTRQKLLQKLRRLWAADGTLSRPVDLEDLMDDLACLGVDGAGDVYLNLLKKKIPGPLTK